MQRRRRRRRRRRQTAGNRQLPRYPRCRARAPPNSSTRRSSSPTRSSSASAEYADLFDFDHDFGTAAGANDASPPSGPGGCKVFPGDEDWPPESKWDAFDEQLDKALILTVPLAAPCYPERKEYDVKKCEDITARWADAYFQ